LGASFTVDKTNLNSISKSETPGIEEMKTISNYKLFDSGFMIGIVCAVVCVVLFAAFESVHLAILDGYFAFENLFSVDFELIVIYGNVFALFPAGLGGYVLELFLRSRSKKGLLTEKWAMVAGMLLAGSAVMVTCGIGLAVLILIPHHSWRYFLSDFANESFFANVQYYVEGLIKFVSTMVLEIIAASLLACTAGGFAGKFLAKRINNIQMVRL
jgi:hypothetical protein